jgi:hypothetical protein
LEKKIIESKQKLLAKSKSKNNRLVEKLQEQLRFIQRSCAAFDQGAEEEAIRIAASLRVIFHNTNSSTSIISHLGFGDKKILSSSRGHGNWQDFLAQQINLSLPQPIRMLPLLGDKFIELSIEDWWRNEPVFVHNAQKHSRRKIII